MDTLPKRHLGENGPSVSAVGLGAMRTSDPDMLTAAADCGMTFWDTADIYFDSEEVIGKWFAATGRRDEIFLASKFGGANTNKARTDPTNGPISTPTYIKSALERSLARLQTDHIDLYYQHRVDPNVPIEVVLEALREPLEKGVIKWIGLSECSQDTLRRAKAVKGVGEKVIATQMEFSPLELFVEKSGFADEAKRLGVSIVAYSPLGRGLVSGRYRKYSDIPKDDPILRFPRFSEENFPKNVELADKLEAIAAKYDGATPGQVALAWILAEHPNFVPIPGSRTVARVEDNARAAKLQLSSEDVKNIRSLVEAAEVKGIRYPQAHLNNVDVDSLPLEKWNGEN